MNPSNPVTYYLRSDSLTSAHSLSGVRELDFIALLQASRCFSSPTLIAFAVD